MNIAVFDSNFNEIRSQGSNKNKLSLVQMMAWCWEGDNEMLSEATMFEINDAYMSLGFGELICNNLDFLHAYINDEIHKPALISGRYADF